MRTVASEVPETSIFDVRDNVARVENVRSVVESLYPGARLLPSFRFAGNHGFSPRFAAHQEQASQPREHCRVAPVWREFDARQPNLHSVRPRIQMARALPRHASVRVDVFVGFVVQRTRDGACDAQSSFLSTTAFPRNAKRHHESNDQTRNFFR